MTNEYKVLARKYRPKKLADLVGQDALVRTLKNAIEVNRIPHAFLLTGIRGVGKTSSARIIARSLVCTGENGDQVKPTIDPCGKCENCKAISEDRHMDIIEIDAASNTGVDNIREIISSVNYAPALGRYKIYIIDEVHMLSKAAFNALLKTLEEPPSHVKFIFATTETRKIPITIISRCMRFDLARLDVKLLAKHLRNIAEKEEIKIGEEPSLLLANVAEGSVRDGLSLLDQVIHVIDGDEVTLPDVQKMLGLADQQEITSLFESIIEGKIQQALKQLKKLYLKGADSFSVLNNLLEVTHHMTQIKLLPEILESEYFTFLDKDNAETIAKKISLPFLSRLWQMLLKGIEEVKIAANSYSACQMVLIRITHISDLPTPSDLVRSKDGSNLVKNNVSQNLAVEEKKNSNVNVEIKQSDIEELVFLCEKHGNPFLQAHLKQIRVIEFDRERKIFSYGSDQSNAQELKEKIKDFFNKAFNHGWQVIFSEEKIGKSLKEFYAEDFQKRLAKAKESDEIQTIMEAFPTVKITGTVDVKDYGGNLKKKVSENL